MNTDAKKVKSLMGKPAYCADISAHYAKAKKTLMRIAKKYPYFTDFNKFSVWELPEEILKGSLPSQVFYVSGRMYSDLKNI